MRSKTAQRGSVGKSCVQRGREVKLYLKEKASGRTSLHILIWLEENFGGKQKRKCLYKREPVPSRFQLGVPPCGRGIEKKVM